jgi:hypothetical protein
MTDRDRPDAQNAPTAAIIPHEAAVHLAQFVLLVNSTLIGKRDTAKWHVMDRRATLAIA